MIKIICSAQSFGYGPCSKLVTFVKHIREIYQDSVKIDFIGDDVALMYALQNAGCFNNIFEYQGEYPNAKEYDLVISSMNPYTAIWGWFNRKKIIYIDSLYWFWDWKMKNFQYIQEIIKELRSANNINGVWSILKEIDDHHLQYIAHRLSSVSCIQKIYSSRKENLKDSFRKNIITHEVGPIICASYKQKANKRNKILISLGGLYSPLNGPKETLRYVNFVLNLIDDFVELLPKDIEVILTTNLEITSHINSKIERLTITSLNNQQFLKTLNEAIVTITPPSITTIYESLFYNVPLIFLPEQHDGHFPNFLRLSSGKITLSKLRKIFPELLFNTRLKRTARRDADAEILYIQSFIKKFSSSSSNPTILSMKEALKKCLVYITDENKREDLLKSQQGLVLDNLNILNTQTVQNLLDKLLRLKTPIIAKKCKVGVISSAVEPENKDLINEAKDIGKILASLNIDIHTGASIGYAQIIGASAKNNGSRLIGYSPAKNSFLHQKKMDNAPIVDFDEVYFNENGFTARSLNFLTSVDAVIMLAGRMGTLSEFTIALEEGIPVFVLKGFGGISDDIEQILSLSNKETRSNASVFSNKKELIKLLINFLNSNYYH